MNKYFSLIFVFLIIISCFVPTKSIRAANYSENLLNHFRNRESIIVFETSNYLAPEIIEKSDQILNSEFALIGKPPVKLPIDLAWNENPYNDRSWEWSLHTMQYIDYMVERYKLTKELRYLQRAEDLIMDWISDNSPPPSKGKSIPYNPPSEFSWHDHTAALRAQSWLPFFEVWVKSDLCNENEFKIFIRAIMITAEFLSSEKFYKKANNHGIDQDISLIGIALTFPEFKQSQSWLALGQKRLEQQITDTISQNGVHLEHSPGYHLTTLNHLNKAFSMTKKHNLPISENQYISETLDRMGRFAAYLIKPDGRLSMFGDTSYSGGPIDETHPLLSQYAPNDPILKYVLTRGKEGKPYKNVIFQDEGYVIFRDLSADNSKFSDSFYLMFTAANNKGWIHKHMDDLSFILFAYGHDLLIDPGKFTYNYDTPGHKYVTSRRAHNVVTVDNNNYLSAGTTIDKYFCNEQCAMIKASYRVHPDFSHERTLLYLRPQSLILVDEIQEIKKTSSQSANHTFEQLFHFAPNMSTQIEKEGTIVKGIVPDSDQKSPGITITQLNDGLKSAEIICGSDNPMQGWVSLSYGSLIKAPVAKFIAKGSEAVFVTHLSVAGDQDAEEKNQGLSPQLIKLDEEDVIIHLYINEQWQKVHIIKGEKFEVLISEASRVQ